MRAGQNDLGQAVLSASAAIADGVELPAEGIENLLRLFRTTHQKRLFYQLTLILVWTIIPGGIPSHPQSQ